MPNLCQVATCDVEDSNGDSVLNGNESDTDCGGPDCNACADGERCRLNSDCLSLVCDLDAPDMQGRGVCSVPTCQDDAINGGETALNCGGPCPGCQPGQMCRLDSDCASEVCDRDGDNAPDPLVVAPAVETPADGVCLSATCTDLRTNGPAIDQMETDTDCGGPNCPPCADLLRCTERTDCETCLSGRGLSGTDMRRWRKKRRDRNGYRLRRRLSERLLGRPRLWGGFRLCEQ